MSINTGPNPHPFWPSPHPTHYRSDLRYDNVMILWEQIFMLKAALDTFLAVILLIGTLIGSHVVESFERQHHA